MATYFGQGNTQYVLEKKPLGGGGEAEVYRVSGNSAIVAKIYKQGKATKAVEEKIKTMIANAPNNNGELAWPISLLYDGSNRFVGFTMPFANADSNLRETYVIDNRGNKPWNYFVRIARNICAVINNIHEKGHVVGDLNPENILVNTTSGTVIVVDTDSFHIADSKTGNLYRCLVAKPEFIAPELKGVDFKNAPKNRTFSAESDRYSLAILIFSLLINGAHPFSCSIYNHSCGEKYQQDKNMENGICVYFPDTIPIKGDIGIPKYSMGIEWLPQDLKVLFHRAFVDGHKSPSLRPTAEAWFKSLINLERSLVKCSRNANHLYPRTATKCPWCSPANNRYSNPQTNTGAASAIGTSDKLPSSISKTTKTYIYWEEFLRKRGISVNSVINSYKNKKQQNTQNTGSSTQSGSTAQPAYSSASSSSSSSFSYSYTSPTPTKYAIKYYIDGKLVIVDHFEEGETVFIRKPFNKSNLTTSPWMMNGTVVSQGFPMPNHDIELKATTTIPQYSLRYKVNGSLYGPVETHKVGETVRLRERVVAIDNSRVEWKINGMDVSGTITMPNHDVVIAAQVKGAYLPHVGPSANSQKAVPNPSANKYVAEFKINGTTVTSIAYYVGDYVDIEAVFKNNGYKTKNWRRDNVVARFFYMPTRNVVVTAELDTKFTLKYYINGNQDGNTESYNAGDTVNVREAYDNGTRIAPPWKLNGTSVYSSFTMPDCDVVLETSTSSSGGNVKHAVEYYVDGSIVARELYASGERVKIKPVYQKKGYTTSNWEINGNIATDFTMLSSDVKITATSSPIKHSLHYLVDGVRIGNYEYYKEGECVGLRSPYKTSENVSLPWKDGNTEVTSPFTMPDHDVVLAVETSSAGGSVKYAVEYFVDGSIVSRELYAPGDFVKIKPVYTKSGFNTSVWCRENGIAASDFTMPYCDVKINATSTPITQPVTYLVDGKQVGEIESYAPGETVKVRDVYTANGVVYPPWKDGNTEVTSSFTMPNHDVILEVETPSSGGTVEYAVEYYVDGSLFYKELYAPGESVKIMPSYSNSVFNTSVWCDENGVAATDFTMPDHNVKITTTSTPIRYSLIYLVDGKQVGEIESYAHGESVRIRGVYTLSGVVYPPWKDGSTEVTSPFIMPDHNVMLETKTPTVKASPIYTVKYFVNKKQFGRTESYVPGDVVTLRPCYTNDKYVANRWIMDGAVANSTFTMPDHDVIITSSGSSAKKYKVNYYINGVLVSSKSYIEGEFVMIDSDPLVENKSIPWQIKSQKAYNFSMPAHDVSITANSDSLKGKLGKISSKKLKIILAVGLAIIAICIIVLIVR